MEDCGMRRYDGEGLKDGKSGWRPGVFCVCWKLKLRMASLELVRQLIAYIFVVIFLLATNDLFAEDAIPSCISDPMRTAIYSSKITCGTVEIIVTTISDSYTPYMDIEKAYMDASDPGNHYIQKLSFYDLTNRKIIGVSLWVNQLSINRVDWEIGPFKCTSGKNGNYLLAWASGLGPKYEWEEIFDMHGHRLTEVNGKFDENTIRNIAIKNESVKKKLGIKERIDISSRPIDKSLVFLKTDFPVNYCPK
jgi:hypothetical protein